MVVDADDANDNNINNNPEKRYYKTHNHEIQYSHGALWESLHKVLECTMCVCVCGVECESRLHGVRELQHCIIHEGLHRSRTMARCNIHKHKYRRRRNNSNYGTRFISHHHPLLSFAAANWSNSQPASQPASSVLSDVATRPQRYYITFYGVCVCVCLMCGCWCTTHKEVIVIVVVWRPSSIHRAYCKIYACGLENDFFSILCCVFLVLVHRCGRLFSSRSHQQRIPNQSAVNASAAREESMLPSANIFERCTILFSICSNDCQYEQKWSTEQKVLCRFDFIVRNYAVYLTFNALRVARHTFNEFHVHTQLTVSMGCYRASLNTPKWTETFAL